VTFKQDSIIPNETLMEKMKREEEEAKEKEKAEQE